MDPTSDKLGTFLKVTDSSVSKEAARAGRVRFLAPLMAISPYSGTPPVIFIHCNTEKQFHLKKNGTLIYIRTLKELATKKTLH
jgi:hypothetical protein